jgi:putative oxidoreductase
MPSSGSSHPTLSYTDRVAANWTDFLLLAGRVLIGWLFLKGGWDKMFIMPGFTTYLTNLGVPNAGFWAWPAMLSELLIGITLILGLATRYAALYSVIYLIITIVLAHRYWTYPAAQQANQFNHFLKNLAMIGGSLFLFVTGGGRYSVDAWLAKRRYEGAISTRL